MDSEYAASSRTNGTKYLLSKKMNIRNLHGQKILMLPVSECQNMTKSNKQPKVSEKLVSQSSDINETQVRNIHKQNKIIKPSWVNRFLKNDKPIHDSKVFDQERASSTIKSSTLGNNPIKPFSLPDKPKRVASPSFEDNDVGKMMSGDLDKPTTSLNINNKNNENREATNIPKKNGRNKRKRRRQKQINKNYYSSEIHLTSNEPSYNGVCVNGALNGPNLIHGNHLKTRGNQVSPNSTGSTTQMFLNNINHRGNCNRQTSPIPSLPFSLSDISQLDGCLGTNNDPKSNKANGIPGMDAYDTIDSDAIESVNLVEQNLSVDRDIENDLSTTSTSETNHTENRELKAHHDLSTTSETSHIENKEMESQHDLSTIGTSDTSHTENKELESQHDRSTSSESSHSVIIIEDTTRSDTLTNNDVDINEDDTFHTCKSSSSIDHFDETTRECLAEIIKVIIFKFEALPEDVGAVLQNNNFNLISTMQELQMRLSASQDLTLVEETE